MTYTELLNKYIKKIGRDVSAAEVVYDLNHIEYTDIEDFINAKQTNVKVDD